VQEITSETPPHIHLRRLVSAATTGLPLAVAIGVAALVAAEMSIDSTDDLMRYLFCAMTLALAGIAGFLIADLRISRQLKLIENELIDAAGAASSAVGQRDGLTVQCKKLADAARQQRTGFQALSEQARKSSRQIANTATKLSLSAERLTEASEDLNSNSAASLEELTRFVASLRGIEDQAHNANALSERTRVQGEEGRVLLGSAAGEVRNVVGSLGDSSKAIEDLNKRTRQLDGIITRITEISNETNLLALNAAIEAARSGEAGRGFAVVADKVRNLADQSKESARHVAEVLVAVRKEAEIVGKCMSLAVRDIDSVDRGTRKVDSAMRDICERASSASEAFSHILAAISDQSRAADRISEQLGTVSERSQNNRVQARTTLDAVQRLESLGQALYAGASGNTQD
jgi:methyl-accepting chemotaxis protein